MTPDERAKAIHRAIQLAGTSLNSHLAWTYAPESKMSKQYGETQKFHKACVKEYGELIFILCQLY